MIHTVGPVWRGGTSDEPELLASCHRRSLAVAQELGAESIAFPAISCGIFGYPPEAAAPIAVAIAREQGLQLVRFVLFNDETYDAFVRAALSAVDGCPDAASARVFLGEKITAGTSSSAGSTSRRTTSKSVTTTAAIGTAKSTAQPLKRIADRRHRDEHEQR